MSYLTCDKTDSDFMCVFVFCEWCLFSVFLFWPPSMVLCVYMCVLVFAFWTLAHIVLIEIKERRQRET